VGALSRLSSRNYAKITIETEDGRVLKFRAYRWDLEMRANNYPVHSIDQINAMYMPGPTTGDLRFEILPSDHTVEQTPEDLGVKMLENYLKLIGVMEEE
jgi:hypothetical protein